MEKFNKESPEGWRFRPEWKYNLRLVLDSAIMTEDIDMAFASTLFLEIEQKMKDD